MSDNLWFLQESHKPLVANSAPGQQSSHQNGPPDPDQQHGFAHPQSHTPGQNPFSQGAPLTGEAASYLNASEGSSLQNHLPNQGSLYNIGPPIDIDNRLFGVQEPHYGSSSLHDVQQQPYDAQPPPYTATPEHHDGVQPPYEGQSSSGINSGDRTSFGQYEQHFGTDQVETERSRFSSRNPLDPAPYVFSRRPPDHYSYAPFSPISVLANTENLYDGFAEIPPPAKAGEQHPFQSHDITQADWHKFLNDLQKTAHLSPTERLNGGFGMNSNSRGIQDKLRRERIEPVGDFLLAWNQHFFHPRRMSIVLARGRERYSGNSEEPPPDLGFRSHLRSDSDHSSESESDRKHRGTPGGGLLVGKVLARKGNRLGRRVERRQRQFETIGKLVGYSGSGSHHSNEENWEEYVCETKFRLICHAI